MKYITCGVPLFIHGYTVFHRTKNASEIRKQVENVMEHFWQRTKTTHSNKDMHNQILCNKINA